MTSVKKWWISARPFSFSASVMPVVFGALLAQNQTNQSLHIVNLVLSVIGMWLLHAGANMLNDIHDFRSGLDKVVTPVSGGVVRGWISETQAWRAVLILFVIGSLIGVYLCLATTLDLLYIGVPGLLIGWLYSHGGRWSMKYQRLGDLAVFLNFGTLGALGSWMVQTQRFSWLPVIWSIPISLFVIGIVHANNWRDIQSDQDGQVKTVANSLGDRGSLIYYSFMVFAPYAMLVLLVFIPLLPQASVFPMTGLLTLLSLPLAIRLFLKALRRKKPRQPLDFIILDGATGQLNLIFGILISLSLLLDTLLRP